MNIDDVLRIRRLSKRIKLLSGIEPRNIDKGQSGELMLMIMEAAEELEKISERNIKAASGKS